MTLIDTDRRQLWWAHRAERGGSSEGARILWARRSLCRAHRIRAPRTIRRRASGPACDHQRVYKCFPIHVINPW